VGCDSSAILILKVNLKSTSTTNAVICQGNSYPFNGISYFSEGTYSVYFSNAVGCDSAAILILKVNKPSSSTTNVSICQGDSYTFNGTTYTSDGTYTTHLTNAVGCDSTATLILKVNQPTAGTIFATICQGFSYSVGGDSYKVAGTYYPHITNVAGCDSAITLHLSVAFKKENSIAEEICSNETYLFGNSVLTQTGTYTKTFSSVEGCDSVVTLNLTVKPSYIEYRTIQLVYGKTDTVDGKVYDKAGTFTESLTASNGCDSTVVTTVINVKTLCPKIIVPPYFTPNGDGINDFFEVEDLSCYTKSTVDIYDRYGKRVAHYNGTDLGWDGNYLGHAEPSTDYWYIITLPETAERITGHVTLKR
jgi:trimeric autotransporter adhesin